MSELVTKQVLLDAAIEGDAAALEQLLLSYFPTLERDVGPQILPNARTHLSAEDV